MTEQTAVQQPAIYGSLQQIQSGLGAIPKGQKVDYGNTHFQFRGIDDVQKKLFPLLKKYSVVFACASRVVDKLDPKFLLLTATYRLTSLIDGSYIETVSTAYAALRDDRCLSAAGSTAYKYAIFELFCVPVYEAQDNDQHVEEISRMENEHNEAVLALNSALQLRTHGWEGDQKREYLQALTGHADFRVVRELDTKTVLGFAKRVQADNAAAAQQPPPSQRPDPTPATTSAPTTKTQAAGSPQPADPTHRPDDMDEAERRQIEMRLASIANAAYKGKADLKPYGGIAKIINMCSDRNVDTNQLLDMTAAIEQLLQ